MNKKIEMYANDEVAFFLHKNRNFITKLVKAQQEKVREEMEKEEKQRNQEMLEKLEQEQREKEERERREEEA